MPKIPFIQYLKPNGGKRPIYIDRPEHVATKAAFIRQHGFHLAIEILTTEEISMTVSDRWGDYAFQVVDNGPPVPPAVDHLILNFDVPTALKQRSLNQEN